MKCNHQERIKSPKKPPNLIFSENHNDPAAKIVMLKMLKTFKKMGYTSFYDEIPKNRKANEVIKLLKDKKDTYDEVLKKTEILLQMSKLNLNEAHTLTYDKLKEVYKKNEVVSDFLAELPSHLAMLTLMHDLKNYGINYVPIDIKYSEAATADAEFATSEEGMIKRDKRLAKKYLNAEEPVFGRVGVLHLDGIKKHLENSNDFLYFFVYSSDNLLSKDLLLIEMMKDRLPDDVIILDISQIDENKFIQIISDAILKNMQPEEPIKIHRQNKSGSNKSKDSENSTIIQGEEVSIKKLSNPTPLSYFFDSSSPISIDEFDDSASVCNYLFDQKYNPAIVSSVLKLVLDNNNIDKLFPKPFYLCNVLTSIFTIHRPAISGIAHEKLKNECFELFLNNQNYFSKFNENDFTKLEEIFNDKYEQLSNMFRSKETILTHI